MTKYNNWCDEIENFVWVDVEDSTDKKTQITKCGDNILAIDIIESLSPRINVDEKDWEMWKKYEGE